MKTLKQQLQERIKEIPEPESCLIETGWSRDEGASGGYYDHNFNEIKENLSKLPDDIIQIFRKILEQKPTWQELNRKFKKYYRNPNKHKGILLGELQAFRVGYLVALKELSGETEK